MAEPPELCAELLPVLRAELAAGNAIAATGPAMSNPSARQVLLAHPFRSAEAGAPEALEHRAVNDPHWWKEELRCRRHGDVLACGFE